MGDILIKDPLKIEGGYVSGLAGGDSGNCVCIYRGVPYAAPPVGNLRWKPPQPVTAWPGVLDCTDYRPACPQFGGPFSSIKQSEDCLYLNIVTPAQKASDKLPVMVWFHGGGLDNGSGNDPLFNGCRLPQNGIVQVAVGHRLGALGLVVHPLLSEEAPNGLSGNYLFLDLIAALQWVRKNIAVFGGDPDSITVFGESGGGMKVHCLLASPLAKGLFHRAICESGADDPGRFEGKTLKKAEALGEKLFTRLGVKTLKEARSLNSEKIVKTSLALAEEMKIPIGLWAPTVDGSLLLDTPAKTVASGKHNAVPLMVGANLGELGPGVISLPQLIPTYLDMLSGNYRAGAPGYAYIFDQVPAGWRAKGGKSTHAIELSYVFGDYDNSTPYSWSLIYDLQTFYGITSKDPGLTETDKKVSLSVMLMWARFARTGDPHVAGLIDWPAWQPSTDRYLYIAEPLKVKSGFSKILSSLV
jgi:para-nitrobenzyl esterase